MEDNRLPIDWWACPGKIESVPSALLQMSKGRLTTISRDKFMNSPSKRAGATVLMLLGISLLVVASRSLDTSATRLVQDAIAQTTPMLTLTPQTSLPFAVGECISVLFRDEFDGNNLDQTRWDVFSGTPAVSGGWLTLPGAEIQSKVVFQCGVLQGVIQSSDWKPQNQFTDSSFGFEVWTGSNGQCHYGILFKPSGHLAVLRSQPDANGNCSGDPLYQAYPPISNWDAVRAGGTVSFTLSWCSDNVVLEVKGNGQEGQASYTGQAMPTVLLKIRLYAQPTETYNIDYIQLCPCHAVYLPIVIRQFGD